jgi:mersacidin/lichenicidin family type 2 lantibiotic
MRFDIVRAWKDETYRQSLSAEQLATLPAHPAGTEMSDADLEAVMGGWGDNAMSKSASANHAGSSAVIMCDLVLFTITGGIFGNVLTAGPTENCVG